MHIIDIIICIEMEEQSYTVSPIIRFSDLYSIINRDSNIYDILTGFLPAY